MSRRRLFSQVQDNDDNDIDQEVTVKSALPLSKTKAQLVNGQPVSGEDYLLMVRDQASKCATTAIAKGPPPAIKKTSLPPSFSFFQESETPEFLLPDPIWQQKYAESFKSYQLYMQNNKPKKENTKLPSNWRTYYYDNKEPDQEQLDTIAHCTQQNIITLLRNYKNWLTEMTYGEALWISTLLIYLDPVMVAQHVSVLRELARKCIKIRNEKQVHDDNVIRLNMIITIIAKVFGQADMI